MIVYLADKTQFRDDILSNRIEEIVHDSFRGALGKSVSASELASWKNSLRHMDTVLEDSGIPDNAGVAIEFNIPQTGKRVDFIVTGTRGDGQRTAVIVDKAHCLNEKSEFCSNLGENQIKELNDANTVTEMDLESQFRCNGSDGYLAWIDCGLQIRETAKIPYRCTNLYPGGAFSKSSHSLN